MQLAATVDKEIGGNKINLAGRNKEGISSDGKKQQARALSLKGCGRNKAPESFPGLVEHCERSLTKTGTESWCGNKDRVKHQHHRTEFGPALRDLIISGTICIVLLLEPNSNNFQDVHPMNAVVNSLTNFPSGDGRSEPWSQSEDSGGLRVPPPPGAR
ncbi:unnamed protein product [Calypogeia fissa]